MAAAMLTFSGQGVDFYGDMMAMIFCGIFFLFFHRQRFTINQRTAVTAASLILFNCLYYAASHIMYLFSIEKMILEVVAVVVYIRVFNTVAKVLFVRKFSMQISSEKLGLAYEICVVSLIGAIHFDQAVFPLWVLTAVIVQYCRGVQWAMVTGAVAAVFWKCQFSPDAELFIYILNLYLSHIQEAKAHPCYIQLYASVSF